MHGGLVDPIQLPLLYPVSRPTARLVDPGSSAIRIKTVVDTAWCFPSAGHDDSAAIEIGDKSRGRVKMSRDLINGVETVY